MNCISLLLYVLFVYVICINNKYFLVYKIGDKFVFFYYIVWCIMCMVVMCIFFYGGYMFIFYVGYVYIFYLIFLIELFMKIFLWGFVLFIILFYMLSYYIFIRNNIIYVNICSVEVLFGLISCVFCDGEFVFFLECLNCIWSDVISFRFEFMIKIW